MGIMWIVGQADYIIIYNSSTPAYFTSSNTEPNGTISKVLQLDKT